MKFLKRFFVVFFGILVLALIAGLFMKKEYTIEREVTITRSNAQVFDYIKHLKNQDEYSYWNKQDPTMKKKYVGKDATVGFIASWDGNDKVGQGEQEIKEIIEGERVDFELRFKEPMEMTNNSYMTTKADGDGKTKVVWGFAGKMNYPMNIMIPFMGMDKMLGDQLQAGLDDLKKIMEDTPPNDIPAPDNRDTIKMVQ